MGCRVIQAVRSLYNRCQSLVRIAGNDVVLLASSARDLDLSLDRFAAACEAAGMKISTSKSEAMVLNQKKVECLLQVKEEILPQVEELKYLGVLFTSEGRMEQETDRPIGAASAVMRTLHQKRALSIYRSIFVPPTLTYGGRPPGRPRTRSRDYVSRLVWERLGIPPDELEEDHQPGHSGGSVTLPTDIRDEPYLGLTSVGAEAPAFSLFLHWQ
ncbi:hypothetical protein D4764_01G0016820 [Takifugu flavidus]|uniref:Reverse transcriptase domain-containing protein n=1 Tax=Takifugu flavidus TaxID=433684 RepID=A0A5C6PTR1_9TELE|nr:hypothetical protein D4764_01G0016820 [Takifugu flavidus]